MEKRPELNKNISIQDFKDFYWLKEELRIVPWVSDCGKSRNQGEEIMCISVLI